MTASIQKKICMLGGFSVGKTSLVKRYVESVFSEAYLTTVGVRSTRKPWRCRIKREPYLWDLAGEDDIARCGYATFAAPPVTCWSRTEHVPSTLDVAVSLRRASKQTMARYRLFCC